VNPRKQRQALRQVINHMRAGAHTLVEAGLPLSLDEVTRLIQTLERHYRELPGREERVA
jgi:hypothetical protein